MSISLALVPVALALRVVMGKDRHWSLLEVLVKDSRARYVGRACGADLREQLAGVCA